MERLKQRVRDYILIMIPKAQSAIADVSGIRQEFSKSLSKSSISMVLNDTIESWK